MTSIDQIAREEPAPLARRTSDRTGGLRLVGAGVWVVIPCYKV